MAAMAEAVAEKGGNQMSELPGPLDTGQQMAGRYQVVGSGGSDDGVWVKVLDFGMAKGVRKSGHGKLWM